MFEAIEMLNQVLKVAVLDEEKDETLKSSLRLQLDALFGSFNGILTTAGYYFCTYWVESSANIKNY